MAPPELRIGLIGCGTVGGAFCASLDERRSWLASTHAPRLSLTRVAVVHPDRPRSHTGTARIDDDAAAIAHDPSIDIVVEASGAPRAGEWITAALARGAAVVTANKQALARDPALLRALAEREPRLWCEGAVAAAIPIVRALRESLSGDEVRSVRGVLNGTTTYVLSRLEHGGSFDDAVLEAQHAGYAEADPASDLSGADAAAKLAILCSIAWREPVTVDRVLTSGLDAGIATQVREAAIRGNRVRLVATASRNGALYASVAPEVLEADDPLARVEGVHNVVVLDTTLAGTLTWHGAGAGGRCTASAVLADTIAAARALLALDATGRPLRSPRVAPAPITTLDGSRVRSASLLTSIPTFARSLA